MIPGARRKHFHCVTIRRFSDSELALSFAQVSTRSALESVCNCVVKDKIANCWSLLWQQERSVANCASSRPHMLQISFRDETYLTLNSVMTLRHSRKRDKVYLKKVFYLRNFLNLLRIYRIYLSWKYRKRVMLCVTWQERPALLWKEIVLKWNPIFQQPEVDVTVICRFHQCQLTLTYLINSPRVLSFDIAPIDKIFHIPSGRETLRRNVLIVCEGGSVDDDSRYCERNCFMRTILKFSSVSF